MSPETTSTPNTKICPTCGTRLAENATRCLVCGTELSLTVEAKKPASTQASRMPEITLSLPTVLGLLALFLIVGAALVFFVMRMTGSSPSAAGAAQGTPTNTPTPTVTVVFTEAATSTPVPTATTQPPHDYTIAAGDTCTSIAVSFGVSVQSIIILNNLPVACNTLSIGQAIKIPYPTPTPLPEATATLEAAQATLAACEKVTYTVQDGDTLGTISANYAVPGDAIKAYNGLSTDTVFLGMNLTVPLCERAATPGPTPTATIPPPYPAANLLLPADGASFTLANDNITLQWASIGTLRDNEAYIITIEDVTEGQGRRLIDYASDTKFIVPVSFRPKDNTPHIFRWFISTVRQTGTDDQGQPIWDNAGENSTQRVFSWQGVAPEATPKP
ncbi:MAG: LysM peptidoglycan-binding domain-containing protein [Chloroflexi bacterium]|nr:LysM peptidoglycan-binding domain-containing protein [Chloroflexota bacterium]